MIKFARFRFAALASALLVFGTWFVSIPADAEVGSSASCVYWVAKQGSDNAAGTNSDPWATVTHAVETVPDDSCTIEVKPGTYREAIEIERRFTTSVEVRAAQPYRAIFEGDAEVLDVDGARAVTFAGFIFRHDGPGASGQVINVDNGNDLWAEDIKLRNNIIHDSYDDDLLKIHAGVRHALVDGNIFYNQGHGEQHMDVNSVTDVTIQDNIFFNDFARSGRGSVDSEHFIVVKDSGVFDDGLKGAARINIRRNVFMNWEGDVRAFLRLGNGGKPYHEAKFVRVNNNLFLGNSSKPASTILGMSGVRDVSFINNTVVGDLPTSDYAFNIKVKGSNPVNRDVVFANNIWSDPTGTMDEFAGGDADSVTGLVLDSNLYWNGGSPLPDGDVISPSDDSNRTTGNPGLTANHGSVQLPNWGGSQFESGATRIRDEFIRLVDRYAAIPDTSRAVDRADPSRAPSVDILGNPRDGSPDLGAFEADSADVVRCRGLRATHVGTPDADTIVGTAGRDVIVAKAGDDVIRGARGDDVICAGAGADTVYGGPGRDDITGGGGDDRIMGGAGGDTIRGGAADDWMSGNRGSDRVMGQTGDDGLHGNWGNDRLDGGAGANTADGGRGTDACDNADVVRCESGMNSRTLATEERRRPRR